MNKIEQLFGWLGHLGLKFLGEFFPAWLAGKEIEREKDARGSAVQMGAAVGTRVAETATRWPTIRSRLLADPRYNKIGEWLAQADPDPRVRQEQVKEALTAMSDEELEAVVAWSNGPNGSYEKFVSRLAQKSPHRERFEDAWGKVKHNPWKTALGVILGVFLLRHIVNTFRETGGGDGDKKDGGGGGKTTPAPRRGLGLLGALIWVVAIICAFKFFSGWRDKSDIEQRIGAAHNPVCSTSSTSVVVNINAAPTRPFHAPKDVWKYCAVNADGSVDACDIVDVDQKTSPAEMIHDSGTHDVYRLPLGGGRGSFYNSDPSHPASIWVEPVAEREWDITEYPGYGPPLQRRLIHG